MTNAEKRAAAKAKAEQEAAEAAEAAAKAQAEQEAAEVAETIQAIEAAEAAGDPPSLPISQSPSPSPFAAPKYYTPPPIVL